MAWPFEVGTTNPWGKVLIFSVSDKKLTVYFT